MKKILTSLMLNLAMISGVAWSGASQATQEVSYAPTTIVVIDPSIVSKEVEGALRSSVDSALKDVMARSNFSQKEKEVFSMILERTSTLFLTAVLGRAANHVLKKRCEEKHIKNPCIVMPKTQLLAYHNVPDITQATIEVAKTKVDINAEVRKILNSLVDVAKALTKRQEEIAKNATSAPTNNTAVKQLNAPNGKILEHAGRGKAHLNNPKKSA